MSLIFIPYLSFILHKGDNGISHPFLNNFFYKNLSVKDWFNNLVNLLNLCYSLFGHQSREETITLHFDGFRKQIKCQF